MDPPAHEVHMQPGQDAVVVSYHVHNQDEQPVSITELRSTCGCGEVAIDRKMIPSDGQATITLRYTPGDRSGTQRHLVLFTSRAHDDEPGQVHRLGFTAHIPEPFKMSRSVAFWRRGGPDEAIAIRITGSADSTASIQSLEKPEGVEARFEQTEAKEWVVHLRPVSTEKAMQAKLFVITDASEDKYRRLPITVLIK